MRAVGFAKAIPLCLCYIMLCQAYWQIQRHAYVFNQSELIYFIQKKTQKNYRYKDYKVNTIEKRFFWYFLWSAKSNAVCMLYVQYNNLQFSLNVIYMDIPLQSAKSQTHTKYIPYKHIYTYRHTHTYIHIYRHTYIYIYIHIYNIKKTKTRNKLLK